MSHESQVIAALLMVLAACSTQADEWRSELYPANWSPPGQEMHFETDRFLQDFSYAGYRWGEEPIPNPQETVFDVVADFGADPSGQADSTQAIQDAIDKAGREPNGGVVYLPEGEYKITVGENGTALRFSRDNVILRGAGPDLTRIINHTTSMRRKNIITVMAPGPSEEKTDESYVLLTQDLLGPAHRVYLEDASAFETGDLVQVRWDLSYGWIKANGQTKWWGHPGDPDPNNPERAPGPACYSREVTAVDLDKKWIELNAPLPYAARLRDNARVHKIYNRIKGCGIESLSIGNVEIEPDTSGNDEGWGERQHREEASHAGQAHGSVAIHLLYAQDCWIKDVDSVRYSENTTLTHLLSNGIRLHRSFCISIIDCDFKNPQYGGGGRNGYLIQVTSSGNNLIARCTTSHSRHGLVLSGTSAAGNVFFQCVDAYTKRSVGNGTGDGFYETGGEGSDTHNFFTHSNLWDSCHVNNSRFEAFHRKGFSSGLNPGPTSAHGVFWNTSGEGNEYPKIVISDQMHYGYIIGTSGPTNMVSNKVNEESNQEPEDFLEGIGRGDRLTPQSLWLDQREKRLGSAAIKVAVQ